MTNRLPRTLIAISLLLAPALAGCGSRPPRPAQPTAEEYAVWAVAIDTAVHYRRVAVQRQTEDVFALTPAQAAKLRRTPGMPRGLVADFLERNSHPVHVNVGRIGSRRVGLVPKYRGALGPAVKLATDGSLLISRVGFDASGRHALVGTAYSCGALCGEGSLLLMERGPDGRWRLAEIVGEIYS